MLGLRRRTAWVLAGWFMVQFAGIGAPLLFAAKTAVEELCFCPDAEPGAACPMHKAPTKTAGGNELKSDCTPSDAALLALAGGAGILPEALTIDASTHVTQRIEILTTEPSSVVSHPDSPPPRS
jgi:hypothetical protein